MIDLAADIEMWWHLVTRSHQLGIHRLAWCVYGSMSHATSTSCALAPSPAQVNVVDIHVHC